MVPSVKIAWKVCVYAAAANMAAAGPKEKVRLPNAYIDSKLTTIAPLDVSPVNLVHMAVAVPPETKSVSFHYQRPTLRGKALALLR